MAGYGTLEWQEEQRRKEAMQQQQPQNNAISQKSEKTEQNVEIIKNVLQLLQKNLEKSIEDLQKEVKESSKNNKTSIISEDGLKKALNNTSNVLNGLIDGNLKGIADSFASGAGRLGVVVQGIIKGFELANKITEKQATINQRAYLSGANLNDGFYSKEAHNREFLLSKALFGQSKLDETNLNRFVSELSSNYALNLTSEKEYFNLAKFKGGLEGAIGGRFGVSNTSLNQLQFNATERYGISSVDSQNNIYQQILAGQEKSRMPMQKFIDSINSISNQSIKYGGTLEYAEGLMSKFGKEVNKGTISLENLTAVSRGIANGSVQQNAGLASYLLQTGNLPTEAMKFAGSPLGLSGWIRNNAENNGVQRGLENAVRQEMAQMGLSDTESKQEYFRMRYASFGFNLDQKQYEKLARGESLTPDDIKSLIKNSKSAKEANFYDAAEKYYQNTSSLFDNIRDIWKVVTSSWILNGFRSSEKNTYTEAVENEMKSGKTKEEAEKEVNKKWVETAKQHPMMLAFGGPGMQHAILTLATATDKNTEAVNKNTDTPQRQNTLDPNL